MMPRRTKPYIGPAKMILNGGRCAMVNGDDGEPRAATTLVPVPLDIVSLRDRVENCIQQFDELAQLDDRDQFIKDLADECAFAMTLRLDLLTRGTRTKPDEWTTQVLVRGVASVLEHHNFRASISEYECRGETRRSLYLRLAPGLIKIAGYNVPKDIKGLWLRARRITHAQFRPNRSGSTQDKLPQVLGL